MEWSSDFKSADDVTLYLIANLRPLSKHDEDQANTAELKGRVVLCYGAPGKMHYITHFAKAFHFWIGTTLYASDTSLSPLIQTVAISYTTDFLE